MSSTTLRSDRFQWLFTARRLPGRVHMDEAAALLGFALHDLPLLISKGLLTPCGNLKGNTPKYFSVKELLNLCEDEKWLAKATKLIVETRRQKNSRIVKLET